MLKPPSKQDVKQAARIVSEIEENHPINLLFYLEAHSTQKLKELLQQVVLATLVATAKGQTVAVTASDDEVSTQYAADFLNVSRPYVVKLCDEGKLPYRMEGTHRRIRIDDLGEYMEATRKQSEEAMQALMDQAQDLDMGY